MQGKNKNFIYLLMIMVLLTNAFILGKKLTLQIDDSHAATTMAIVVDCVEQTGQVFVPPTVNVTVSPDSASQSSLWSGSGINMSASIDSPVNNDDASLSVRGAASYSSNFVTGGFRGPAMKTSGFVCSSSASTSIEATVASDHENIAVSLAPYSQTGFNNDRIVNGSSRFMYGGSNALISTSALVDTANSSMDSDGSNNGEITIGGTTSGDSAYTMGLKIKVVGGNPDGSEAINFSFTPGS